MTAPLDLTGQDAFSNERLKLIVVRHPVDYLVSFINMRNGWKSAPPALANIHFPASRIAFIGPLRSSLSPVMFQ